jgi:hypothetical protein
VSATVHPLPQPAQTQTRPGHRGAVASVWEQFNAVERSSERPAAPTLLPRAARMTCDPAHSRVYGSTARAVVEPDRASRRPPGMGRRPYRQRDTTADLLQRAVEHGPGNFSIRRAGRDVHGSRLLRRLAGKAAVVGACFENAAATKVDGVKLESLRHFLTVVHQAHSVQPEVLQWKDGGRR